MTCHIHIGKFRYELWVLHCLKFTTFTFILISNISVAQYISLALMEKNMVSSSSQNNLSKFPLSLSKGHVI